MHHLRVALLLTVVLISGCNPVGAPTMTLEGRTFLSSAVTQGGVDRPLVPGTQVRLQIQDGNVGASAGCNSIGGTYRIDGDRFVFEGGSMTEMGCDEPRDEQDDWLAEFLGSRPAVTFDGDDIALAAGDTVIRLTDREVVDPDRPLVGPLWTVTSIRTGDMMMAMADGAAATLRFTGDGGAELATGCNQGSAVVGDAGGGALRFSQIALTKRACIDVGADMEQAMLAVLRAESVSWSIDAGNLTLNAGDRGLVLSTP